MQTHFSLLFADSLYRGLVTPVTVALELSNGIREVNISAKSLSILTLTLLCVQRYVNLSFVFIHEAGLSVKHIYADDFFHSIGHHDKYTIVYSWAGCSCIYRSGLIAIGIVLDIA
jgi:hypothetical protein